MHKTLQKIKDLATRTALKTGVKSCAPEGSAVSVPHVAPVSKFKISSKLLSYYNQ